jgi:hypothetical protein
MTTVGSFDTLRVLHSDWLGDQEPVRIQWSLHFHKGVLGKIGSLFDRPGLHTGGDIEKLFDADPSADQFPGGNPQHHGDEKNHRGPGISYAHGSLLAWLVSVPFISKDMDCESAPSLPSHCRPPHSRTIFVAQSARRSNPACPRPPVERPAPSWMERRAQTPSHPWL